MITAVTNDLKKMALLLKDNSLADKVSTILSYKQSLTIASLLSVLSVGRSYWNRLTRNVYVVIAELMFFNNSWVFRTKFLVEDLRST